MGNINLKAASKLLYKLWLATCSEHFLVPGVELPRPLGPQDCAIETLTSHNQPAPSIIFSFGGAKKYEAFSSATAFKRSPNKWSLC